MSRPVRILALVAGQRRLERGRLLLASGAGAVVTASAVCLLGLSGWFITGAALAGGAGAGVAQAFNYLLPSALIRLLAILRTGGRYIERVAGHEAALKALARLRPQLFRALASGPPQKALALSTGEASARLIQDVDAIQTLFVRLSAPAALIVGAGAAAILVSLATPLAALLLVMTMVTGAVGALLLGRALAAPAGRAVQVETGVLKDRVASLEAASAELRAYGMDGWATGECATVAARLDRAQLDVARAGGLMAAWQAGCSGLAVLLVVIAAVQAGTSSPMIALAALAAVMGMEAGAGLVAALQNNGAAVEAMSRLEDALSAGPEAEVRQPSVRGPDLTLLGHPLQPPGRLGILGVSGAGKTTLIEQLIGLREAPAGRLTIGGVDVADICPAARRSLFAYVAQDVRLIDGTFRQNLTLAGPADDAALWAVLEDVALAARVRAAPLGLDTPLGADGSGLSGGERRRLTLARACLRNAPWLVLDEPTEGLDPETESRVLHALDRRLKQRGQGLILISHRTAPTRICDSLIRLPHPPAQTPSGPTDPGTAPRPEPEAAPAARS
ncbi:ATP-binding cassette domain-containing protein [Rhizobium sp. CRIBSB]|nr:ATP-binding cassette domain-containing protein [Rhizobium sp. CRIBSB]